MLDFRLNGPRFVDCARRAYRDKAALPKAIARSVLEALNLFARANAMPTGQLHSLRDHFGGAEKVRYQCEQHILVKKSTALLQWQQ